MAMDAPFIYVSGSMDEEQAAVVARTGLSRPIADADWPKISGYFKRNALRRCARTASISFSRRSTPGRGKQTSGKGPSKLVERCRGCMRDCPLESIVQKIGSKDGRCCETVKIGINVGTPTSAMFLRK